MISKHLGLAARRRERMAGEELQAGHRETALDLYFSAAALYASAQHVIFETNAEKEQLHGAALACYERVQACAPYEIRRLVADFEGGQVAGYLHIAPNQPSAPCVFFVPGCDMTKEQYPHPLFNHAAQRGMHILSFDGPGQGESNLRDIRLTADNYERAASAMMDVLATQPEVDSTKIAVYGLSFGSHWATRVAAHDPRFAGLAAMWASFADKRFLMELESPRYKQLFAYLTRSADEDELDAIVSDMRVDELLGNIACPTLVTVGEFDPRAPLEEIYRLFALLNCPAELWVLADQHHKASLVGSGNAPIWLADAHWQAMDWLRDRLAGIPVSHPGETLYLNVPSGQSPYGQAVERKTWWYEDAE
jgi:pimeloyl-ACP methyl ester carboxylesterase